MHSCLAFLLAIAAGGASADQTTPLPAPTPEAEEREPFKLGGEMKIGYRWSQDQSSAILTPLGATIGFMRTPDAGSSIELQDLAISGEGMLASGVFAKFEVRFLDLYNRNPTSTDARVFVRQAFIRFGEKSEPLSDSKESRLYLQAGMAPRFSKQMVRPVESYGLWGTALGRFEQPQVEVGADLGAHVYLRGMVGAGNPLFLRDTNALAGDELSDQLPRADDVYQSGFPILYDAKWTEINTLGGAEWGGGFGTRFLFRQNARVDALAWTFRRKLAETARVRGTDYPGELGALTLPGVALAVSGRQRHEWGVNLQAKAKGARLFAQWIDQDIAGLGRHGLEAEASWTLNLNGFFLLGESPFGNWIQPSFRYSSIANEFTAPLAYPRLSIRWPWKKYDVGLRMGLVRDVDLTAEYTIHEVIRFVGLPNLPMREFLLTLRAGF